MGNATQGPRGALTYRDKRISMQGASWVEPSGAAVFMDDFLGDTMSTDDWLATETDNGGTSGTDWAISATAGDPSAGHGGWVAAKASVDADDASEMLASALAWKPERAGNGMLVFEAGLSVPSFTTCAINVGLTDDRSADKLPFEFATATWTPNASDAALFVFDTDATSDLWRVQTVDSNTDGTAVAFTDGVGETAATYQRFRIEINSAGECFFYHVEGVAGPLAYIGAVITGTSPDVLHAGFFGIETRTATTTTAELEVDYCLIACARS